MTDLNGKAAAPDGGRRLRVLIADDCRDNADIMATLVRLWGHEARRVYDGAGALAAAAAFLPDLVLLDILMPGRDGFEVARELRRPEAARGVTLVAVTGLADDRHRRLSFEAGFDRYLVKPVRPAMLEELLARSAARLPRSPGGDARPLDPGAADPPAGIWAGGSRCPAGNAR